MKNNLHKKILLFITIFALVVISGVFSSTHAQVPSGVCLGTCPANSGQESSDGGQTSGGGMDDGGMGDDGGMDDGGMSDDGSMDDGGMNDNGGSGGMESDGGMDSGSGMGNANETGIGIGSPAGGGMESAPDATANAPTPCPDDGQGWRKKAGKGGLLKLLLELFQTIFQFFQQLLGQTPTPVVDSGTADTGSSMPESTNPDSDMPAPTDSGVAMPAADSGSTQPEPTADPCN